MEANCHIWLRLGAEIHLTEEEREELLRNRNGEVIKKAIAEGRWELFDDAYIPRGEVESINKKNGTDYKEEDIGFIF